MAVWYKGKRRKRFCNYEIRLFAFRYRAESAAHTHGICGIDCAGIEGLLRSKAHPDASERHYKAHVPELGKYPIFFRVIK